jgi:predicted nucleotidyltransferase
MPHDSSADHPRHPYATGTQVVTLRAVVGEAGRVLHPRGSVAVVVRSPRDLDHSYRLRFPDGLEESLPQDDVCVLAQYQEGLIGSRAQPGVDLFPHTFYRCIMGSRAYGLETETSDTDYRGVYLPPADVHWSLYGVPDQLEREETQEHYWEVQRFLVLALKSNPNVLETLYSPLVVQQTELGAELLAMRESFLSKLVYQTYNGYVMSQFKKMQADLRQHGTPKPKHVMHLIRLLLAGICILRHGHVPVKVEQHRDELLQIKRGQMSWADSERWRAQLHQQFDAAFRETSLPDRPDYERANAFLVRARRMATG